MSLWDGFLSWEVWQDDSGGLFLPKVLQINTTVHLVGRLIVPGLRTEVNVLFSQLQIVWPLRTYFAPLLYKRLERLGLLLEQVVNLFVDCSSLVVEGLQLDAIWADLARARWRFPKVRMRQPTLIFPLDRSFRGLPIFVHERVGILVLLLEPVSHDVDFLLHRYHLKTYLLILPWIKPRNRSSLRHQLLLLLFIRFLTITELDGQLILQQEILFTLVHPWLNGSLRVDFGSLVGALLVYFINPLEFCNLDILSFSLPHSLPDQFLMVFDLRLDKRNLVFAWRGVLRWLYFILYYQFLEVQLWRIEYNKTISHIQHIR